MSPTHADLEQAGVRLRRIHQLVEAYCQKRAAGENVPDDRIIAQHPELMPELEEELQALRMIQRIAVAAEDAPTTTATAIPVRRTPSDAFDEYLPGYDVVREIHRGGQGIVYEAVQNSTQRTVAVKVLLGGALADQRAQWRFEREVRLIAALKHPNIVVIHDSGVTEGCYFYAMDYVRGEPLDTHVRMGQMNVRTVVSLFAQVCEAVAHAHTRGVVHRDLKPSNILVGQDGHPYVLDFGLAKILANELQETQVELASVAGNLMGTVAYMAPEQTLGDSALVDTRTDVYAMGVILYRLITGRHPYEVSGDLARVLTTIQEADPPRPSSIASGINSELDAIILKSMEKEPNRRYQSAHELQEDLEAWIDGRPVAAKSASTLYLARKIVLRHKYQSSLAVATLIAIAAAGTIAVEGLVSARNATNEMTQTRVEAVAERSQFERNAPALLRQPAYFAFGWFLAEWYAGHHDRAVEIRDEAALNSPEYAAAMDFLLSGGSNSSELENTLAHRPDLLAFVLGEHHLHAGRSIEAKARFGTARKLAQDSWILRSAEARLKDQTLLPPRNRP